jgi:secondary thiamine-phosphate synthase enzyme
MQEHSKLSKISLRAGSSRNRHTVALSDAIFEIKSEDPIEFVDLTDHINQHLAEHGVENGHVTVFSRHTTAAIKINEAEELLLRDFKRMLVEMCPPHRDYEHNDMARRKPPIAPDERPNAHSHCMQMLLSTSETIPVVNGALALGTWQRVFMVELDGPRERQVWLRSEAYLPHEKSEPIVLAPHNGVVRVNGSHRLQAK